MEQTEQIPLDRLDRIWQLQREFRDRIIKRKADADLDFPVFPEQLWDDIREFKREGDPVPDASMRIIENRIDHYATCMSQEVAELRDWTRWKDWSNQIGNKDPDTVIGSDQHLGEMRIEVADLLCFLLNTAAWLGMDAEMLYDIYRAKVNINHARQDRQDY